MTEARRVAVTLVLTGLVLTSGCSFLTGQSTLTVAANDVAVSSAAQSDTGYAQARDTNQTVRRNLSAAGQTRTVEVVNRLAEYDRAVDLGPLGQSDFARFTVLATPQVEVAGQTLNPVGDMSNADLARTVQKKYGTLQDVTPVSNRTETMLGHETTVSKFSAQAETDGQSVDVYLQLTRVSDGDDYVIAIAVYPQRLDEQQKVNRLLAGVQHG